MSLSIKEEWRDIKGYEGKYRISNLGDVYSFHSNRLLKPWDDGLGYERVDLSKNGVVETFQIHRLVAEHFIPNDNPNILIEVNHKDLNPSNNKVDNLEWCTHKDNIRHAGRNGKMARKGNRNNHKLSKSDVLEIRQRIKSGMSVIEIAQSYGVCDQTIYNIKNGDYWKDVK